MVGKPRLHRGCDSQSFVNAAEIVKAKMQSNSSFQIVELLRERISEAGKPSHLHSHGQVLPFHVGSRNVFFIRVPEPHSGYNLRDWAWGVFGRMVMLAIVAIQLDELRKVNIVAKEKRDLGRVKPESVRGDLRAVVYSLHQVANKIFGRGCVALPDGKRRNQFRLCIHSDKDPLVAKLCGVILAEFALLLKTERPNFVTLDVVANEIAHPGIVQTGATFSRQYEQLHDGVTVQSGHAFRGTNRAAFNEALNGADGAFFRDAHCAKGANGLGIGKGCRAVRTAVTLDSTLSVAPEFLNGGVLASGTGHGAFPLEFWREKPENKIGSGSWLTPRFGLAPQPVSAGSGAHSQVIKSLWRFDFDSDCDSHVDFLRSESPVSAGLSYLHPKSFLFFPHLCDAVTDALFNGANARSHWSCAQGVFHRIKFGRILGNPFEYPVFLVGFLNKALIAKARQRRVDHSVRVAVAGNRKAGFREPIFHGAGEDCLSLSLSFAEDALDSLCEPKGFRRHLQLHRIKFLIQFIFKQRNEGADGSFGLVNLRLNQIALLNQSRKLFQFLLDYPFFVTRSHKHMPRIQVKYTRVLHKSSSKLNPNKEIVDSWDSAIRKAKRKIENLRMAIRTFEESKLSGDPWPGENGYTVTDQAETESVPA